MRNFLQLKTKIVIWIGAFISILAGFACAEGLYEDTTFPAVINIADLNGTNGFVMYGGIGPETASGVSVNGAGDINGDGIADILIGAPEAGEKAGQSYVVFGSKQAWPALIDLGMLDGINGFIMHGSAHNSVGDYSGVSISGVGDVNGDGIADILIGAPFGNDGKGQSYVVFGSRNLFLAEFNLSNLDGTNGFVIHGVIEDSLCGYSVSGAGDVNGDGIVDILIGAPGGAPGSDQSESYVVFGSKEARPGAINLSNLNGNNGFVINGTNPNDQIGYSVSGAGDVNGDGIADILIGALGVSRSYIVFGSKKAWPGIMNFSNLDGNNGFVINGVNIGYSVNRAGDVNGDGIDDILIGAPDASRSYVVFGKKAWPAVVNLDTLNGNNGFAINGVNIRDFSGNSVSRAGDVNGDGIADILIGASDASQSYVVFGSRNLFPAQFDLIDLNGTNGFVINGTNRNDGSGWSVSGAGDVNGDGVADILIGAPFANNSAGQIYVIFGCCGQEPSANTAFILELALGIGGGILTLVGLSVGSYYGYQHCQHGDYVEVQ